MSRYPVCSAVCTASVVSSGGVWNTPKPRAGISTPLFKVRFTGSGSFASASWFSGRRPGLLGGGQVEQHHGVVVRGAGFGEVDGEALTGGVFQLHALEAEGDRADLRVVEGLLRRHGAAGDLVAFPQLGEVGALEQELADEGGQVGCVGIGTGQGPQAGDAAAGVGGP